MKQEQQAQARRLYMQANLSKSEIAENLGVDRRTIYQWSVDGDWEKLKISARNMPSILAEKCYYLIGHFTDHLLSRESSQQSVTKAEVDMLHKLAKTVMLLKKGSTINENMETFTWFLEGLQTRDAQLAEAVAPYAETFINARAANGISSFTLSGHDAKGHKPFNEKEIMEKWLDEQDAAAILNDMKNASPSAAAPSAAAVPSAVETEDFPSLHNTVKKNNEHFPSPHNTVKKNNEHFPSPHNTVTENNEHFPSPHNTVTENNEHNTQEQNKEYDVRKAYEEFLHSRSTPQPPRTFSPSLLATIAKAEKIKARQLRFEEEKARKEAARSRKAA